MAPYIINRIIASPAVCAQRACRAAFVVSLLAQACVGGWLAVHHRSTYGYHVLALAAVTA